MKTGMKFAVLGAGLAAALAGATAPISSAEAATPAQLIYAVGNAADQPNLEQVQYFYGGRNFCWYDSAWSGPGYYWCGYAWRRGFGWGGGYGWRGWGGGYGRGYGHGGYGHGGFNGGHGGFHGGGGGHHH